MKQEPLWSLLFNSPPWNVKNFLVLTRSYNKHNNFWFWYCPLELGNMFHILALKLFIYKSQVSAQLLLVGTFDAFSTRTDCLYFQKKFCRCNSEEQHPEIFFENFKIDTYCFWKKLHSSKLFSNIADMFFWVNLLPIKEYGLWTYAFLIHSSIVKATEISICHSAIFAPIWIKQRIWTLALSMQLRCVPYFLIKMICPIDSEQIWWQKYIHDSLNC